MLRRTALALVEGDKAYTLLGVRRDFDVATIRNHWRKRAKKEHPDMFPNMDDEGKKVQAGRFAELKQAWAWIEANHEEQGHEEIKEAARFQAAAQSHPQDKRPAAPESRDFGDSKKKNSAAAQQARDFINKKNASRATFKEDGTERSTYSQKNPGKVPKFQFTSSTMPGRPSRR